MENPSIMLLEKSDKQKRADGLPRKEQTADADDQRKETPMIANAILPRIEAYAKTAPLEIDRVERVRLTWGFVVSVWHRHGAWHRRCECGKVGVVCDASGAFEFITRLGWVCAECRPHTEARRVAPVACLGGAR